MTRAYKNKPGPKPGTLFPDRWASGPDMLRHQQYKIWVQQRNQAQWRGEEWELDFDTWVQAWGSLWNQRGRSADEYCMTRSDYEGAWAVSNIEIVTRSEHTKRQRAWLASTGQLKGRPRRRVKHGN